MKRLAWVCTAAAVALLPLSGLHAQDPGLQKLMGENYQATLRIMVNLIEDNHQAVVEETEALREHAEEISHMASQVTGERGDQFRSYAYNLESRAENLRLVMQTLIEREGTAHPPEAPDYLRDVAAAHFGAIVVTCVGCHNQFRFPQSSQ